ncbi:MAG: OsmC family protein [Alistipes sp.]|nr:OsmC family protein [Alistipes sp.]
MTLKITLSLDSDRHFKSTDGRSADQLNPKELLLYAAANCAGLTIIGMLKEHISTLQLLELSLEGTLSTPTVVAESRFTSFNIIYRAECPTLKDETTISRAINLAHDKYCGLLQMLRKIAPLSHEVSIVATNDIKA